MNITFFFQSRHGEALQDPEFPENHPLSGSETAMLRLAQALRRLGEDVRILTDASQLAGHQCDIFVSLILWQVFHNGLYLGKRNFLWCQDDVDQQRVKPLEDARIAKPIYDRLDGVIQLSHYAARRWVSNLNLPVQKIVMSTNGIPMERFKPRVDKLAARKPWAYYASTPFRGLEQLLIAWPYILQAVPEAQLHICSSMKIYDPAGESDSSFLPLYEKARSLPGIHYHGSIGQAELRKIAEQCRVLAYPCVFPETSCIAAMEAMAAGCVVSGTDLGALPETAWQNPLVPMGEGWLNQWIVETIRRLKDNSLYIQEAQRNLAVAKFYDWSYVAKNWIRFLK